jgi:hypothetical protein
VKSPDVNQLGCSIAAVSDMRVPSVEVAGGNTPPPI